MSKYNKEYKETNKETIKETNKETNKEIELKIDSIYNKPIIKWIGGKTQILSQIIEKIPKEFNNYHEIFIGGGAVLFRLLHEIESGNIKVNGSINAYDINKSLINLYKNIQNNHSILYEELEKIIKDYNDIKIIKGNKNPTTYNISLESKESYYYWIRNKYNSILNNEIEDKNNIMESVYFIFLNKTGFRGLYRINSKGKYNVPYGNYKNPQIINYEHLNYISNLIKDVNFECKSFDESISNGLKDDFIYMDPPYAPENDNSFVNYTESGFDLNQHILLFNKCDDLNKKNIKFMMNNSDVKIVRNNFEKKNYKINSIICKRKINSKNPESKTNEVIIQNY